MSGQYKCDERLVKYHNTWHWSILWSWQYYIFH
jgi:hypothetical protein